MTTLRSVAAGMVCLLALAGCVGGAGAAGAVSAPAALNSDGLSALPDNPVLAQMGRSYSAADFAEGQVTDEQVYAILLAAARAPSAKNAQPWHFTVVKNDDLVGKIYGGAKPGNVVIVLSGNPDIATDTTEFDCGLAAGYMQLAAESLGLGARLLLSPVAALQKDSAAYGIPQGYQVQAAMIIGPVANAADAATGATGREPLDRLANVVE